jgi:hypothetical protein
VIPVEKGICDEWITNKHYSRRPSIFWAGFGLVVDTKLEGVCVFGQPSAPIQKHAFTARDFRLYELSRLVVQTTRKNAASFLIAGAIKQLEAPCAIVSYADSTYGHCGYVYQATNWLYTGATKSHDHLYLIGNERLHPMTVRDRFGVTNLKDWAKANNIQTIPPEPKHRYFFLHGDRRQKRQMLAKLKYSVVDKYPKMTPRRYDAGPELNHIIQERLI